MFEYKCNTTDCFLYKIFYSSSQAGEYKCKISQMANDGSIISILPTKSVFVNISPVPIVVQQQPPALLEIKEGEEFTINCTVYSHPEPCYQWFRDNTRLEGETCNVLHVSFIYYGLCVFLQHPPFFMMSEMSH